MYVLVPKQIGDSMMLPGTIPAVDTAAGEALWVAGQAVSVGNERNYGQTIYRCAVVPVNLNTPPDQDPVGWAPIRPTNRYAPFDTYVQTAQVNCLGSLSYVLKVPFINGLALHGLMGKRLRITVTDGVGGPNLIPPIDTGLNLPRIGWWNYFFGERTPTKAYRIENIPSKSSTVITVTVSADAAQQVGIGWMSIGNWTSFGMTSVGVSSGTQYGASADLTNYSYRKEFEDGTFRLVTRGSAVNLTLPVVIDAEETNRLFALIERLKDTPVSVFASSLGKYRYLATVGQISIGWQPDTSRTTTLTVNVKGVV